MIIRSIKILPIFIAFISFPLKAQIIISDSNKIDFSHSEGFYSDTFELSLSTIDTSFLIVYTLDGSNPNTSTTKYTGKSLIEITVNPERTFGRGATPAFVVRAALSKEGYLPTFAVSKTYIFPEYVKKQGNPSGEWPQSNINSQRIEYDMDSAIIKNPVYAMEIDKALIDLPSICISTDLKNLFDAGTGIIVNAGKRGEDWERECSAELIFPDGREGFQLNAGLRIRGGSSRSNKNPKHSFRLFFRNEYGAGKLEFPLFDEEGVSEFDKIDLRTAQNYSWNADEENNHLNTLVRDIFSRDAQRELGKPYARGRFYHLYLNGMYWGIFQTQERTEARYAESYFGNDKEDYDVIKVTAENFPYYTEVTDGNDNAWEEIWKLTQAGFSNNKEYFLLEGRDGNGLPLKNSKVLVDIDNLIDYMLLVIYTGNFDAPTSAFWGNRMPNNFYAIYDRKNLGQGFIFCAHDSEHSMMLNPVYAGIGLYENRVDIADRDDWFKMECSELKNFNPQWIHYNLTQNREYRVRFAERAYQLLNDGGVFTPERAKALFAHRVNEIDTAIVAESARWGDARVHPARTKYDDWLPEINNIYNNFFPNRTDIVKQQLIDADLLSEILPPVVNKSGNNLSSGNYEIDVDVTVELNNLNDYGYMYYTLSGADPRKLNGVISSDASLVESGHELSIQGNTIIYARIKSGFNWSPLMKVIFYSKTEIYSNLKVTELHYKPKDNIFNNDTVSGKNYEFIEFKNTGESVINVSELKIDSAVTFTFPDNTFLSPNEFFVVASKPEEFYRRYGMMPNGNFKKNLSNDGEYLLLTDKYGEEILSFTYKVDYPWPIYTGIKDFSFVSTEFNPTGDPNDALYWRSTVNEGGSPFKDDFVDTTSTAIPEAFTQAADIMVFPNPTVDNLTIRTSVAGIYPVSIELVTIDGKLIDKSVHVSKEIIISMADYQLSYGIYLIRIAVKDTIYQEKVIYMP